MKRTQSGFPLAEIPNNLKIAASFFLVRHCALLAAALVLLCGIDTQAASAGTLYAGWSSVDITPPNPVAIEGQMYTRISKSVHDPLSATALALETRQDKTSLGEALIISLDLCTISREQILEPLRSLLRPLLADFNPQTLILNVTHIHTGPVTGGLLEYEVPKGKVMPTVAYQQFLLGRLTEVAVKAWKGRKPALVSWGLGFAVVGHNRRAVYADGSAQMYGNTNRPDFRRFEGSEDHTVQALFFWTPERRLTGVSILVPCPAQLLEEEQSITADFWAEVRRELWNRHGKDFYVSAMTGASGDQSPHLLFRSKAEEARRQKLGLSETSDIGRRIAKAVDEALEAARQDPRGEIVLQHQMELLSLPRRMVTASEAEASRQDYAEALKAQADPNRQWRLHFAKTVMDRFELQKKDPRYRAEVHALRLGEVAILTNPFELFLDYGIRMETRSPAEQTFVVQLSCGYGGYLPTTAAIQGGSYSTKPASNEVGPEGGDLLVDRSVEMIQAMWGAAREPIKPAGTPATHE